MATCTICNLCDQPGELLQAKVVAQVPCNVRRFKDNLFTLWRCEGCGSYHCAEDADLATYYAHYPLKDHQLSFHERKGYDNRVKLLELQGLKKTDRILDYGCGAGIFVDYLKQKGFTNVFGYDSFIPAYANHETLNGTYDAVVNYDVIEHMDDPEEFLKTTKALVKPGGVLVIGTPRAEGVSVLRQGDLSLHPPYHRHILSEKALVALTRHEHWRLAHLSRRSYFDSLIPTVNSRFMWRYVQECGGFLDVTIEPPRPGVVWSSPTLLFLAFFGYFFPYGDNMIATFRKLS